MSTWFPPYSTLNSEPAVRDVGATDNYVETFRVTVPTGNVPSSAVVTVKNHATGADVGASIKVGAASVSEVSGASCLVSQRLANFVVGTRYVAIVTVTTTNGQAFTTSRSFLNCIG